MLRLACRRRLRGDAGGLSNLVEPPLLRRLRFSKKMNSGSFRRIPQKQKGKKGRRVEAYSPAITHTLFFVMGGGALLAPASS